MGMLQISERMMGSIQERLKTTNKNTTSQAQCKKWTNTHQLTKCTVNLVEGQPDRCCWRQQSEEGGNSLFSRYTHQLDTLESPIRTIGETRLPGGQT
jgi:hypothetical protein